MTMNFNFSNPTNLIFGRGALNELSTLSMPGKRALVLISNETPQKQMAILTILWNN